MSNYLDYIRGGEFLIAPSINYKDPYIFKCSECEEYYDEVQALFSHCLEHNQSKGSEDDNVSVYEQSSGEDSQINDMDTTSLKCEKLLQTEEEDDMVEWDCVKLEENLSSHDEEEENKDMILEGEEENSVIALDSFECEMMVPNVTTTYKEPTYSKIFVDKFMKTKLNVRKLIEAYKRQPKLWNNSISNIKSQERNEILMEISKDLQSSVNVELTYAQVAAVIAHIRTTFRNHLNRKQIKGQRVVPPTWYLDFLDFLKPYIKADNLMISSQLEPNLLERYFPDVPEKDITDILEAYKRHPTLWNTEMAENCCENKRIDAFEEMLNDIQSEVGLKVDQKQLKEYIESIHGGVTKLKYRNIIEKQPEGNVFFKDVMFLFDHVGPFTCTECGRRLKSALAFRVHKSQHDGSVPLVCTICNKGFKIICTYTSHVRRHMEDLQCECLECGKKFLKSYDLEIHLRCHSGVKPFCCELCGMSFRHIQTFASHKRKHEKNFLHRCPICSKGFYTKAKLNDHVTTHTNIREFECSTCGKAFKTKKTLSQHYATHDDARRHACPLCGKTFKLKVGVNQHMRTHGTNIEK